MNILPKTANFQMFGLFLGIAICLTLLGVYNLRTVATSLGSVWERLTEYTETRLQKPEMAHAKMGSLDNHGAFRASIAEVVVVVLPRAPQSLSFALLELNYSKSWWSQRNLSLIMVSEIPPLLVAFLSCAPRGRVVVQKSAPGLVILRPQLHANLSLRWRPRTGARLIISSNIVRAFAHGSKP
jgi:hypothetical protein